MNNQNETFNDAFSETIDGLNLTVDQLKTTCITSNNDNFNLDSEGNLVVKSIRTIETSSTEIDYQSIFNLVYPVGSIYININNINPNNLFGGVWEEYAKGKTLVGVDINQEEFNNTQKEGGSKTHILINNEMPSHTHTTVSDGNHYHRGRYRYGTVGTGTLNFLRRISNDDSYTAEDSVTNYDGSHNHTITYTGGSMAHNNLQPYITVYIWKRIS